MKNLRAAFSTRQYMLSKDFEIYYYSDTHMKGVLEHHHDYYEFYLFLSGNVDLLIDGKHHIPKSGDLALIPPHVRHYNINRDPSCAYSRFVFWISTDYCDRLLSQSKDYGYLMQHVADTGNYLYHLDLPAFHALQSKILMLLEEQHSSRFGRQAKIRLCVDDLVLTLNRTVYELESPRSVRESNSLYQNLLSYIEEHIDEEMTLDGLASEFYVSKFHISHVFKENLGISLHRYIIKKRLSRAREAILSDCTVGEAFLASGFKDYSNFFRSFKKEYGVSPQEYQKKMLRSLYHTTGPDCNPRKE